MNIIDLPQIRRLMPLDEPILNLLDLSIGTVDSIETDLMRKQSACLNLIHNHLQNRRYMGSSTGRVIVRRRRLDVVGDAALRGEVQSRVARPCEQVAALGVNYHLALLALHDGLAETRALVAMGAILAV